MNSRTTGPARAARAFTEASTPRQVVGRLVLLVPLHLALAWAASAGRLPEVPAGVVWPAAGVAVLWISTASRRSLPWDLAALALSTFVVAAARDDVVLSLATALVATGAAWMFRHLVRRWSPPPTSHTTAVARLAPFISLAAASLTVALVENAATAAVLTLTQGTVEWPVGLRWWRTLTGVFTLTATSHLVLAAMASRGTPRRGGNGRKRVPARRFLEVILLLLLTLGLMTVTLQFLPGLPLGFLLFVPAAWVGVRFPPVTAAASAGTVGLLTITFTLANRGLFANLGSALVSALVAQTFFLVLFTTTLVLSLLSTQLRSAERRAKQRAQLLDRVMTASSSGVVLVDRHERVLLANRAGRQLLRLSRTPVTADQLGFARLTHSDGTPLAPHEQPHRRALAGTTVTDEDLHLPGDTRTSVLRVSALPLDDEVMVTFTDVSAELAHTTALQEFAGEVAHDLKNPLTVVEGWSEVLEGEFLAAEAVPSSSGLPMARRVRSAATRMSRLVDDLLSYTVARGHPLDIEALDLADVVEEAASAYTAPGEGSEAPVVRVMVQHRVAADRVLLHQLLDNLIGNAVKYVAAGTQPQILVRSLLDGDGRVRVEVADNGLGIPDDQRRRVFESLYRLDRPGYAGTGLGLAICARIVQRHGGVLSVEDGPGGTGSTFVLTLPVAS